MSSESLRLSEFNLDMVQYGKKFEVSVMPVVSTTREIRRVSNQLDVQPDLPSEAPLASTAAELDHVLQQRLVLRQLIELFGTPDIASPLVMSAYALLEAHSQRLAELHQAAELQLWQSLERVRELEQERLHLLEEQETAVTQELERLQLDQAQLEVPESELADNVSALTGVFAQYSSQETVATITHSAARKRNQLLAKIMGAQELRAFIRTQKSNAIENLALIVSGWREIDRAVLSPAT
ncbi:MAG: hypothetical protein WCT42_04355 [Candidatus Paceibacterota bacterium]|jgi:DNA repair ATPase RecN